MNNWVSCGETSQSAGPSPVPGSEFPLELLPLILSFLLLLWLPSGLIPGILPADKPVPVLFLTDSNVNSNGNGQCQAFLASLCLSLVFSGSVNPVGVFPLNSVAESKFSLDKQSLSISYSRTAGVQNWRVEKWGTMPGRVSGNSQLLFHCNNTVKTRV